MRKLSYYTINYLRGLLPRTITQHMLGIRLREYERLSDAEKQQIRERVDYYMKIRAPYPVPQTNVALRDFTLKKCKSKRLKADEPCGYIHSTHFYDIYEYSRYFPDDMHFSYTSGDVWYNLQEPGICKSRPLKDGNENNVLLKLNKLRHFKWVDDPYSWEEKECRILFRGAIDKKPRRQAFVDMWKDHEWTDLTGKPLTLKEHLTSRYIMALEGNDVATNLKWVMSSNSVAVMPKPTCETWFMEGRLIPDYHYIEIREDYSDLIEKITYYENHPDEAKAIARHAHEWVEQFRNDKREDLISLMVLEKYFRLSGQL
ncbi:MAG: glycosyltransferase [Prevotella sp.]|nr:glycosyltransferase [Prevotella sp.]